MHRILLSKEPEVAQSHQAFSRLTSKQIDCLSALQ